MDKQTELWKLENGKWVAATIADAYAYGAGDAVMAYSILPGEYWGPPCKNGHLNENNFSPRDSTYRTCVICNPELRNTREKRLLKRCYYGQLCTRGHDSGNGQSVRYKSNYTCVQCTRIDNAIRHRDSSAD